MAASQDSILNEAREAGLNITGVSEQNGTLHITGTAPYQMQRDMLERRLKETGTNAQLDVKVNNVDYYGEYTIKPGDTLSKIAAEYLGGADKYQMIVEANPDKIKDADRINAGDTIYLPIAAALHANK